jgi:Alpha/beta hydrolase domain
VAGAMVVSMVLVAYTASDDDAGAVARRVPNPIVTAATGGHGQAVGGLREDVTQFGYQETEYLFDGTAKTYPPAVLPPAPYRSRMIVWTPINPSRFNGTTVVEWAEVSDFGQFELTVELNYEAPMLEQQGFAFVLVSAEKRGVCDTDANGCVSSSLKAVDPERYGSLEHPGDAYSFDIFSQALQAIKHPAGLAPLGKLQTHTVIVEGFQRSVDKYFPIGAPVSTSPPSPFSIYGPLNDYLANGADDDARVADAFLIDAAAPAVEPVHYRVPTLHHLDESAIRRTPTPDSPNHVTWEITGAPHADRWSGGHIDIPSSDPPASKLTREEELARRDKLDDFGQEPDPTGAICAPGPRTGTMFPRRFTLNAAVVALRNWARTGERAPAAPRVERVGPVPDSPTKKLSRDLDGNAIGGLRSPIIQVPVATYNGEFCISAGTMTALPPERLTQLYPTHKGYVRQVLAATNEAVAKRFLVCQDAETIMRKASASTIGGPDTYTATPKCTQRSDRVGD